MTTINEDSLQILDIIRNADFSVPPPYQVEQKVGESLDLTSEAATTQLHQLIEDRLVETVPGGRYRLTQDATALLDSRLNARWTPDAVRRFLLLLMYKRWKDTGPGNYTIKTSERPTFDEPGTMDIRREIEWISIETGVRINEYGGGTFMCLIGQSLREYVETRILAKDDSKNVQPQMKPTLETSTGIRIFISHASEDSELCRLLIAALEQSLKLPHGNYIRCTSVAGYDLEPSAHVNNQLITELLGSEVIIAVITPKSNIRKYVLFELGAAWLLQHQEKARLVPLTVGVDFRMLPGPMNTIQGVSLVDNERVRHAIQHIGRWLRLETKIDAGSPAIEALVTFAGSLQ